MQYWHKICIQNEKEKKRWKNKKWENNEVKQGGKKKGKMKNMKKLEEEEK
jgi:hypothetical protein